MLGDGPARPVGLGPTAVLQIGAPANFGSTVWGGQKVLWALDATTRGAVLVRGRQLDGTSEVRFNEGNPPAPELVLETQPGRHALAGGWLGFPSYTRVRNPGCYAYRIDSDESTTVVVFTAVTASQ